MSASKTHIPYYYVPEPSSYPVLSAVGLFFVILGASQWVNGVAWGAYSVVFGLLFWLSILFQWFRQAIKESESGVYSRRVGHSFRWSMSWFIFSEVLFFGAFFSALWWARAHSVPELGSLGNELLWPNFIPAWPGTVPGATGAPSSVIEAFELIGPWPLPTLNTALLLTSGVTLTIAHHALIAKQRSKCIGFMWMTVLLGLIFLGVQGYEYYHAHHELNLTLKSGIFGSTFYMLTGFHGFHVFVGMLMLLFITLRLHKGHFTPENHFGFEGAAWYWHFVDVVWLGLYLLVYWL